MYLLCLVNLVQGEGGSDVPFQKIYKLVKALHQLRH